MSRGVVSCLCIFAGPSLPPEDRTPAANVTYLPPAARGDVLEAARDFDVVLLIDGVFHHELAPSPKECFAALEHARMFGASSMGALRAAECGPFGFTPLGAIANWYARDVIDGDDEVAVLTHPQTHRALTVPSVNVRYVARLAQRRGVITEAQQQQIVEQARGIFYMERTWDDVLECVSEAVRGEVAQIAEQHGDLKRWDARFALRNVMRRYSPNVPKGANRLIG